MPGEDTAAGRSARPGTGPPSAELRRWRLLADLDVALRDADHDGTAAVDAAARLIARELGDLVVLAVLDGADGEGAAVAIAHADPARERLARALFDPGMLEDIRAAAQAATAGAETETLGALLAAGRRAYDDRVGIVDGTSAPLTSEGTALGLLGCARDTGSPPFSAVDVEVVSAAASTVGWMLRAARLRAAQRTAARQRELAFENATVGMSTFDLQGRYLSVNPAGCAILGRSREQVVGRMRQSFAHPEDADRDRQEIERMLAGGQVGVRVARMVRPDGTIRWVRIVKTLVRDGRGRPDHFQAQFADVTDLYEAENRAARLEALIVSSPDFIAMADLADRVIYLNPGGRKMVNLPDDVDVTGLRVQDFLPANYDTEAVDGVDVEELRARQAPGVEEWQGRAALRDWRDDSSIPVLASTFLIRDVHTGEPVASATHRRDMRAEVDAQRALADLAEDRRRLLAELVRVEQNERTRLGEDLHDYSIQTLAAAQLRQESVRILLERGDVEPATQAAGHVADLLGETMRSLRDLLAALEPSDDARLSPARALTTAAQSLFAGSGVQVDVHGELTDVPPDVATVMLRSGREALSNALRHARATTVTVTLDEGPGGWTVQVDDDGVGVPAERPERRGHLGVRAMANRVEALGGAVSLERRAAGGTRVRITVPRPAEPVDRPRP